MTDAVWSFQWDGISGEVQALGGMLGPVWFTANGHQFQPFAVAPWGDDPQAQRGTLPPILQRLRGDFPCVPFGIPETRKDLPDHWMQGVDLTTPIEDPHPHGFSANHPWHLVGRTHHAITIAIDYPADHAIRRLERTIAKDGDLGLRCDLVIEARRDVTLPIGLHPIFQVSHHTGATHLHIPSLQSLHTFPVPVEPGSVMAPDQTSDSLNAIKRKDGTTLDASKLPLPDITEELLAVQLTDGNVRLANPEMGFETTLTWDITTFAYCLLWISNRGRDQYPWNSRFSAIGIEPVAAAFDLGVAHSRNPNSPMGASTAIALTQAKPFKTSYQIAVAPLAAS